MPIMLITARVDTIILRGISQREILQHLTLVHLTPCPDLRGNLGSGKVRTTVLHIVQL